MGRRQPLRPARQDSRDLWRLADDELAGCDALDSSKVHIMKLGKLLFIGLLALAGQTSASADDNLALAYLFGYGGYGGARMQAYTPAPPYFALHPPVYYGQRFTRPYGASPFAAWPQLQPNAAYAPQPHVNRAQVILNPYCTPGLTDGATVIGPVAATGPVVIDNPFYQAEQRVYTSSAE